MVLSITNHLKTAKRETVILSLLLVLFMSQFFLNFKLLIETTFLSRDRSSCFNTSNRKSHHWRLL
jgi:hypothetical protein